MDFAELLKVKDGIVRVFHDSLTDTYSIGLRTDSDCEWKWISKELYDLLVKELKTQKGQ